MILITKTSDQTRQRCVCVCVCVCVVIPFSLGVRLVDAPAEVTQEKGHTGFSLPFPLSTMKEFSRLTREPPG